MYSYIQYTMLTVYSPQMLFGTSFSFFSIKNILKSKKKTNKKTRNLILLLLYGGASHHTHTHTHKTISFLFNLSTIQQKKPNNISHFLFWILPIHFFGQYFVKHNIILYVCVQCARLYPLPNLIYNEPQLQESWNVQSFLSVSVCLSPFI